MKTLETKLHLPPGPVAAGARQALLELLFGRTPIFTPLKYGTVDGDLALGHAEPQGQLRSFWDERGRLTVTGKTASHSVTIFPNRSGEATWTASMTWAAPLNRVDDEWKRSHAQTVTAAMKLLGSPLAYAGLGDDLEAKCWRWVDEPFGGQRKAPTIVPPLEGIPGMFWRLFVDARFADHLELAGVAPSQVECLNGIHILMPYSDPSMAGSEDATRAERALIHEVGREWFYDPERGAGAPISRLQL